MDKIDKIYSDLVEDILENGEEVFNERTGEKTLQTFGNQIKYYMPNGFPLLTTKKMYPKSIFAELEFFIKGLSDKKWLQDRGCTIWDEWANPNVVNRLYEENPQDKKYIQQNVNDLGRIYGVQWRNWNHTYDQLKSVLKEAATNPSSRRLLVSAWMPDEFGEMALPPCHFAWQINISGTHIDLVWFQRSVDVALGLPYNIASYAMLLILIGEHLGLKPRCLIGQLANTHIYENHINGLIKQINREPYESPTLELKEKKIDFTLFNWSYDNYLLKNYKHHEKIDFKIAI